MGLPLPRRILVFRALQLGDLLCATPAFRALRAALPEAEIVLVGLPWARTFAARYAHYLDGFREFPGYPGLPESAVQVGRLPDFLAGLQAERFDLAIQMHGSGRITNPLVALFGARSLAGFYAPGDFCPDPERSLAWPANVPEVWRLLRLLEFLGVPLCGEELDFPLTAADLQAARALERRHGLEPGRFVCIHPGARAACRRWPPECFAAVADALAARGWQIVTTGSAGERELTQAVARTMSVPITDLAGQTDLGSLAGLLHDGRLLVCNDTGVSHLAAALRVPSVVVLHRLSEIEAWLPRDHLRHRPVAGVAGVAPAAVIAQAEDLLRMEGNGSLAESAAGDRPIALASRDRPDPKEEYHDSCVRFVS